VGRDLLPLSNSENGHPGTDKTAKSLCYQCQRKKRHIFQKNRLFICQTNLTPAACGFGQSEPRVQGGFIFRIYRIFFCLFIIFPGTRLPPDLSTRIGGIPRHVPGLQ
jgi:hypothetical protein